MLYILSFVNTSKDTIQYSMTFKSFEELEAFVISEQSDFVSYQVTVMANVPHRTITEK